MLFATEFHRHILGRYIPTVTVIYLIPFVTRIRDHVRGKLGERDISNESGISVRRMQPRPRGLL